MLETSSRPLPIATALVGLLLAGCGASSAADDVVVSDATQDAPIAVDVPVLDAAVDEADVAATEDVAPDDATDDASDAALACLPSRHACTGSGCCAGLSCATTTLGRVCCGNVGAPCATANGEDCCGSLECVNGHCGGTAGTCSPQLTYFPVRARHNVGYDSTAGNSSQWTCDSAHSNSDFIAGDHLGNDIWAPLGSPVVAAVSGTLRYVEYSSYSGNKATIVDDCGWYHFFCHMQRFATGIGPASDGHRVTAGTVIGYVGNTGTESHGVIHLHYSIYPHDDYNAGIDPWPYLHAVESDVCTTPTPGG